MSGKSKDEFEAWASGRPEFQTVPTMIGLAFKEVAEAAWQASRSAIELPQRWNDDGCGSFYAEAGGPHMDSQEVIAAIDALPSIEQPAPPDADYDLGELFSPGGGNKARRRADELGIVAAAMAKQVKP